MTTEATTADIGDKIRCDACPVMCYIKPGAAGACDRYANHDGQLVREVMRSAPDKRKVHFMGKSGELHNVAEVVAGLEGVASSGRIPELPYIWTEVR